MGIKRGEIYWIRGTRTEGSEQGGSKYRPGVIIQNDIGNAHSPTVIVAMMTDGGKRWLHTHVAVEPVGRLYKPSVVLLEQICTVDRRRLGNKIGRLPDYVLREVDEKIKVSLGLVEVAIGD